MGLLLTSLNSATSLRLVRNIEQTQAIQVATDFERAVYEKSENKVTPSSTSSIISFLNSLTKSSFAAATISDGVSPQVTSDSGIKKETAGRDGDELQE